MFLIQLSRFLQDEVPGITATQINFADEMQVQIAEQDPILEENVIFADSLFFNVLDFKEVENFWISGSPETALDLPNVVVLSESKAKEYFPGSNAMGQLIRIDNKADLEVVGVVKDVSGRSHLPYSIIISYSTLNDELMNGFDLQSWSFTSGGYSYVRLPDKQAPTALDAAFEAMVERKSTPEEKRKEEIYLQPLSQIHFDPTYEGSNATYTVSSRYLTMLLLLGGFILLIACVNYVNLSTSFAFTKSKEVGVRKTIGASKKQLFFHYMLETFVVTLLAAVIGIAIALLFLPTINSILGKSINSLALLDPLFITGFLGIIILISFISGAYPAIILSGFSPVNSLKNRFATPGKSSVVLRKGLVVFQFTTSIALIICTLVISRQMEYFQNKELGFNKEAVIEVRLPESDSIKRENFRNLLQEQTGIKQISFCLGAPISGSGIGTSLNAPQLPEGGGYSTKVIPCDGNYLKTYEMEILAGRWFLSSEEKNIGSAVVINRSLAKTLGFNEPEEALGSTIQIGINDIRPTIVGVTEDFHTSSLHENIGSVAMTPFPYFHVAAGIKINQADMRNTLAAVEDSWRKIYPDNVYEMNFIDETLAGSYEQETQNFQIFKAFSFISIFICCIGLWGLISFVVVRKTKEIGIRKVLGATVSGIVVLLSRDFLLLIAIALLLASPVAWYFMDKWLQDFAYRIDIGWIVFAIAGIFAILIAFITISYQAIKAGLANPVKNLRTE
ncbi:ABC transporter permease [Antarcticibacterium sp. 1MA-6-2]|uniref:FtsX-like permease family protein n=1 Tax=Antarcticibacterium sp. 1MA-6-2 TaxID=2908210 RepID=UPI001F38611E|nr:FtsX-like permease family protein [Antarcticibacterium sp. 1MA-6-2]UJH90992.1 ABC transporter permease [Antarcticibacterium sp. 1MA-6-2]